MGFNQSLRFINSRWHLPRNISHMIIYGQTGSGKSQTLKSCVERAFLRGDVKILDLYAGGADEGAYYALKSNHKFWTDRQFYYKDKITQAQEFPVKCLVPMSRKLPAELPDFYQPFTLGVSTITDSDLKSILGSDLTKGEIAIWRKTLANVKKSTSLPDLLRLLIEAKNKKDGKPGASAHGLSSVYNLFSAFERERLFSSTNNPLALDLKAELKNKNVITSLILRHFPEEYWGFIVNYFIHNTYQLVLDNQIKSTIIIVLRELGDFLEGVTNSPQEAAVKNSIIHVVRKGRKHKLFFWGDNQTPVNIDVVKSEFPIKICHKVDNTYALKEALGDLGAMLLVNDDYARLMNFPPGRCFVLTNSGLFNPQMMPPLSRMSGQEGADFYTIWRQEKGSRFKNIRPYILNINNEYKERYKYWENYDLEKKKRKSELKELKKKKAEEEKSQLNEQKLKEKIILQQERELRKQQAKKEKIKKREDIVNLRPKKEVKAEIEEDIVEEQEENIKPEKEIIIPDQSNPDIPFLDGAYIEVEKTSNNEEDYEDLDEEDENDDDSEPVIPEIPAEPVKKLKFF